MSSAFDLIRLVLTNPTSGVVFLSVIVMCYGIPIAVNVIAIDKIEKAIDRLNITIEYYCHLIRGKEMSQWTSL